MLSCKGLCSGEAHPLWNCLCLLPFPIVLVWNSLALIFFPMLASYFRRFWAVLVRLYFGAFGSCACMGTYMHYDMWNIFEKEQAAALGDCDGFKGAALNKEIDWVRGPDLVQEGQKPMQLFSGRIEAKDLVQGGLGDCWLVAALAVMAEHPAAIRACFRESEISPRGKYHVRLYDGRKGAWETVVVDDYIPCDKGTKDPYFMTPHVDKGVPEMWAILLEKAFAKFCGSYGELEGGNARWAYLAMTGDNVFNLEKDDAEGLTWSRSTLYFEEEGKRREFRMRDAGEKLHYSDFFGVLAAYHARKCVMGASIHNKPHNGKEMERTDGLVEGHAYSILDVRTAGRGVLAALEKMGVQVGESKTHELIRLRNPWGQKSWTGAWGRGSSHWETFPEVAKELKYNKDAEECVEGGGGRGARARAPAQRAHH